MNAEKSSPHDLLVAAGTLAPARTHLLQCNISDYISHASMEFRQLLCVFCRPCIVRPFPLNAPRALIAQIQRVGTHSMWRVQASITLFSQTILSENSAPAMRVLRGSSSLFLAPQGS